MFKKGDLLTDLSMKGSLFEFIENVTSPHVVKVKLLKLNNKLVKHGNVMAWGSKSLRKVECVNHPLTQIFK
jgi:hypothetical protein